jgi:hypothetical protein
MGGDRRQGYPVERAASVGAAGAWPTGKSTNTDYVHVMEFEGDNIRHISKIWNAGWAMRELGWGS